MTRLKKPENALEALKLARIFLGRHKWGKGYFHDEANDSYCALGALYRGQYYPENRHFYMEAENYLREAIPPADAVSVIGYNDANNRTYPEVVQWFDKAIKLAEADTK